MKIECPNCGKAYQLPPELIASVIKDYEAKRKPQPIVQSNPFLPPPPPTRASADQSLLKLWRIAHPAKILMLLVTLAWPLGVVGMSYLSYTRTIESSVEVAEGRIATNGGQGPITTRAAALSTSIIAGFICPTVLWGMAMAFLGAIWLVTRG